MGKNLLRFLGMLNYTVREKRLFLWPCNGKVLFLNNYSCHNIQLLTIIFPLVKSLGDMCGYVGYSAQEVVWRNVSCADVGAYVVCDTTHPQSYAIGEYNHSIYLCQCQSGWFNKTDDKSCIRRSKLSNQLVNYNVLSLYIYSSLFTKRPTILRRIFGHIMAYVREVPLVMQMVGNAYKSWPHNGVRPSSRGALR